MMARTEDEKRAQALYMREYRKRNPNVLQKQRAREAARQRAYARLAQKYPGLFATMFDQELRKADS